MGNEKGEPQSGYSSPGIPHRGDRTPCLLGNAETESRLRLGRLAMCWLANHQGRGCCALATPQSEGVNTLILLTLHHSLVQDLGPPSLGEWLSRDRAGHLECNLDGASEATVSTCMRWHLTRAQQPGLTLRQTGPGRGQPGGPGRGLGVAAMAAVSTLRAARVPSSASSRLQLRAGSEADGSWEKTAAEAAQISGGCRPPQLLRPWHPDSRPQPTPHNRPELDPGQTQQRKGCNLQLLPSGTEHGGPPWSHRSHSHFLQQSPPLAAAHALEGNGTCAKLTLGGSNATTREQPPPDGATTVVERRGGPTQHTVQPLGTRAPTTCPAKVLTASIPWGKACLLSIPKSALTPAALSTQAYTGALPRYNTTSRPQ